VVLEPGTTLLLYTDGLVEKRGQSIDTGMETLRQAVAGHEGDLDSLCDDRILEALRPAAPADDVALLALRLMPVATGTELRLTLPAEASVLASLRRSLRQWLGGLGATPEEIHDLVLACGEAATNVLEHAYGPADGLLEVEATGSGAVVSVVVRDHGQWRSPREEGRGRGFLLMKALVDAVEVLPGPEGTEVRLRRELGRTLGQGPPVPPPSPASPATSTEAPIEIARFEGDIDLPRARELEPELLRAVGNEAVGLVVDLSGVRHIDSAGVRLLFQLASRLGLRRQRLAVVVPTGSPVRRVLDLVGLDSRALLASTVEEAITSLRGPQPPTML
jgi:anti-anti-sigma factor